MNSQATMTAAVWHGRKDIRTEQVPLPGAPQPGWVQIRVHWCGICGSDLHEYLAGPVFIPVDAPHPLTGIRGQCILGHEFCGEIVATGDGVEGLRTGRQGRRRCLPALRPVPFLQDRPVQPLRAARLHGPDEQRRSPSSSTYPPSCSTACPKAFRWRPAR